MEAKVGYLDDVFAIFEARHHPVVLVENLAMRWMGLPVCPTEDIDLLVRDSQIDCIMADLLSTGLFEKVEQEIQFRFDDPYTKQVPRLRLVHQDVLLRCISLWSESVYKLSVDDPEKIKVPDCFAYRCAIVEERWATTPETRSITLKGHAERGQHILPPLRVQSHSNKDKGHVPVFIQSLPRMCDAILDQLQDRMRRPHDFPQEAGNRPSYHLSNMIRYMHLEKPWPRYMLLLRLAKRNRGEMGRRMDAFIATQQSLKGRDGAKKGRRPRYT